MEHQPEPDLHSPQLSPRCSITYAPTVESSPVPARENLMPDIMNTHIRCRPCMIDQRELVDSFRFASVILEAMKLPPGHTTQDAINALNDFVTTADHLS